MRAPLECGERLLTPLYNLKAILKTVRDYQKHHRHKVLLGGINFVDTRMLLSTQGMQRAPFN